MNTLLVLIGVTAVIVGVALSVLSSYRKSKQSEYEQHKSNKRISTLFVVLGIALVILSSCFKIVPTGYTGVRTTFGQVSESVVPQGFNPKIPFVQSIELVNNKQQDITIDGQIWGETKEKTPVYATNITVTYQVAADKSAWIFSNVTNPSYLITQDLVSSAVKSAMVELSASEVTSRTKIEPLVKEKLAASINEKYGNGTIAILKVVVNNMDFEESYNAAIAEKSIALQTQQKQEIENDTAIAKAEADKKVAIANAEAKAEATRIKAEAEAEANRLLSESLTDGVLRSKFYESWNGELPKVMGDGTVITDIGNIGTVQ